MANESQVREATRCVRILLKTRGYKIALKNIIPLIENEDISDLVSLTQQVVENLASQPNVVNQTRPSTLSKSEIISNWFVQNYDVIHSCSEVEEGLLHLISRGRVSKEEQERRRNALIARATGTEIQENQEASETTTDEIAVVVETSETSVLAPTPEYDF